MKIPLCLLGVCCFCPGVSDAEIKYFDLGYDYEENVTFYFWPDQMFKRTLGPDPPKDDQYWHIAYTFFMGEHGGTHIDAPFHMWKDGWAVNEIPLDRLLNLPLVIVDVTKKVNKERNYQYTVEDFTEWEKNNGRIPPGSVVLVKSDWSRHYPDRAAFAGMDIDNVTEEVSYHFPGFHERAATFLAVERSVYGVGTESASLDHATIKNFPAHVNFFKNKVWGLENVKNMDGVPEKGATISVLPLKSKRGSGGPSRVIVRYNTDSNSATRAAFHGMLCAVAFVVHFTLS